MKKIKYLIFPVSIFLLSSCNNIVYNSNSSIIDTNSNVIEEFVITFDANGGQGSMEKQIVNSSEFTLNENQFYKHGYNFLGWSLTKNGVIDFSDCEQINGAISSNTTLYALYEFSPSKTIELIENYSNKIQNVNKDIYAYYGGKDNHDITKYIPDFDPELQNSVELQFGKLVYVGTNLEQFESMTSSFIPVGQSYKKANELSLLDAYLELAYSYYYQGIQIQYDQGSSYQRKIRTMVPEDATSLYQKYMDCSTYVSNSFFNAFDSLLIPNTDINSITTKAIINYAKDNKNSSDEIIMYQDNLLDLSDNEKQTILKEFKEVIQPGDLYVYRHDNDSAGHVMLYVGNNYFLHSTGASYNYSSLIEKEEYYTSVEGSEKPEGSVRYQSAASTVYKQSSTRYLFYTETNGSGSNDRFALIRPLNRKNLSLTNTTISRCLTPGLEIEKSADKYTSVTIGDTITYTITIKNNSNKIIKNISINDTIPELTTFNSMSTSYYYNNNGKDLIWNIPSINSNDTVTVSYKVKVSELYDNIGKTITSQGSVGNIKLNTINLSISSLSTLQLNDFVNIALQYYNNENVYYDKNANNSSLNPEKNVVTFNNGANFITTIYKRYYGSIGKDVDISKELDTVTNTNFMNSILDNDGNFNTSSLLYSMMVNGGYGGTVFTKDYTMSRMRTIKPEYLLPGDIISFVNSTATNQYLYLGYVTIGSKMYSNSLLLFTTTGGVKLIYGSDADALLVKFIGYKRFAIIRPSLKF